MSRYLHTRCTPLIAAAALVMLSPALAADAPSKAHTNAPAPAAASKLPPGPVAGANMPKSYVKNMAKMAYVWGWPMVNIHNRHLVFSKLTENGLGDGVLPVAPLNRLTMLTDYIKPEERAVATPNQDVAYGFGILSLEKEPAVFQVPDFGKRFWVYQLGNQRTDTLGGVGQMYGTKPGFYMVVGPNWKGKTPKGIQGVYRSPTNIAYIIPRAFLDDTAQDRAAIKPVVSQIAAYPLSEYDGKMKTRDWTQLPKISDPAGNYYSRAAAAKANIFVNPRRESAYFGQEYDAAKARLNGANAYTITFPKGGLPPVNGFWSLTLYDAAHFFAPNEINRFSLGTKNKDLVYNPDGSLTLYVQNKKPAADKVANWLPAPTGDFELFIRAYWPKAEILQNQWTPPAVQNVSANASK